MSKYRTFKGVERALAQRLNGERTGQTGGADVQTDWLCVEVKTRKHLPQWIRDAIAQAKRNGGISQLPVVILHQVGQRHAGDLVVMTLADFENWFGGGDPGPGAMADARYLAALGDAEAAAWLGVCAPDREG
ncbi:MAG: hypothetical protein HY328_15650 [Chloroflexi bacterium]|nr:hypothetical protein [Chloroflexota bacterium]